MMKAFYFALFVLLCLLGFGSADDGDYPECANDDTHCQEYVDFDNPLPAWMLVHCSGGKVPEESRIKTMARMMDWCYCGNELNTNGLEYAGFSVYEDGVDLSKRAASRTWACSKNKHEPCDAVDDWYNAYGNITRECGLGSTGFFYDAHRQMAWGFETYQDKQFCDQVRWAKNT